jgi:hypothetical protein
MNSDYFPWYAGTTLFGRLKRRNQAKYYSDLNAAVSSHALSNVPFISVSGLMAF